MTQLWVMGSNGKIEEHVGGNFDWEKLVPEKTISTSVVKKETPKVKSEKITVPERRELASLPKKITTLENNVLCLQQEMLHPEFYQQNQELIKTHHQKLTEKESQLEKCYARWQELEDRL